MARSVTSIAVIARMSRRTRLSLLLLPTVGAIASCEAATAPGEEVVSIDLLFQAHPGTTLELAAGDSGQLVVQARASSGALLTIRRPTYWTANPLVASVDSAGKVKGLDVGGVKVFARVPGKSGDLTDSVFVIVIKSL